MLLSLPVRAAPVKTKPLSMEQLEVVQSFLHMVPEGRRMVEEVSVGTGQRAGGGSSGEHSLPLPRSSPPQPSRLNWSFSLPLSAASCHLSLALLPPCLCPLSPAPVPDSRWTEPSPPVQSCTT